MGNVNSFVVDWSIRFLENKDAIKGEIDNIEKNTRKPTDGSEPVSGTTSGGKDGFDFIINYKDKTKYFIVSLTLDNSIFSKLKNDGYNGIFTLNNSTNIRFIVSNWKQLVEFKFLNIYFINPFSDSDKVWVICPYIHDKVCDKTSLEAGLESMSETVNPIGSEELNNKIKLLR